MTTKWPLVRLGDLAQLQNGRGFGTNEWSDHGLPIIRIQNLNNSNAEFNMYDGEFDSRILIKKGDLLFAWSGTVGSSFGPHIWSRSDGLLNQHIFKVNIDERLDSLFAYYALSHLTSAIEEGVNGSVGLRHVTKGNMESTLIPLPPLDEQKRIVAKLDVAQQEFDRLNNNLEQQLSQLTDFDSALLSEMLGDPRHTPDPAVTTKWPSVLLGSMIALEYGKPLAQSDRSNGGTVPVYGANGVKTYTNQAYFSQPSIIVGRKGSAGELHFAPEPFWPLDVSYFVTHDSVITDINYLFYALTTLGLPSLARGVKPGINRNDVYDLRIPLPALDEQKRIVAKLDEAALTSSSLRSNILDRKKSASELQSAILAAAFAGAL